MATTTIRLTTSDEVTDSVRAKLFGVLVNAVIAHVDTYHSDFYHDARWIADHVSDPITFYYAARDTETSIGMTELALRKESTIACRVELARQGHWWTVTLTTAEGRS